MLAIERALEERLAPQGVPLAVVLPGGRRIGSRDARVTMRLNELASLAHIATGQIGHVAQDYVEGRLDFDGSVRDLMQVAAQIVDDEPIAGDAALPIERGLRGRVTMSLCDYRNLATTEPCDSVASVGMFEHVGQAQLPTYFNQVRGLLKPGGLLMNHGITAGNTRNDQLGAGIGDFIERYIFPGGELLHVSHALKVMSESNLEPLDAENLRPHYARTLWSWSDRLEAQLDLARKVTRESVVRAYRLYLAGSAMSFEQGWISLFQMLASRPSGDVSAGVMRGAQSRFPFNRGYMYR